MIACPSAVQWQTILTHELPGPDEMAFTQHAQACASCQSVLETLIRPQGLSLARLAATERDTPLPIQASLNTPLHGQFHDLFRTMDAAAVKTPVDGSPLIPGYEIQEELGRGGMGVVFKARHLELNRLVALKVLRDHALADAGTLARFRDEARAVARLQHPCIVRIYEIGSLEGLPYLALEYMAGPSLERHLQGAPQPPRDAATLLVPLAQAIHAAHLQGILHRDLKPANILLHSCAPEARVPDEAASGFDETRDFGALLNDYDPKITDFGLAKPLDEDLGRTETGMVVGTPSYMAPEQASGQKHLGPAVDIYALGAILYEMLTGRPPFKGVTAYDTIHLVQTEEPLPPSRLQPQVPRDLETICLKCLHKEPTKRYHSAGDLAADVERFLHGRPILARPAGRFERMVKWCLRYPAVAALFVVATLAALAASGLAAWAFGAEHNAVMERDEKELQRQRAEENQNKAVNAAAAEMAALVQARKRLSQVVKANDLLGSIFENLDPKEIANAQRPLQVILAEKLDQAVAQLDEEAIGDPVAVATIQSTFGKSLVGLGEPEKAILLLEKARVTFHAKLGPDNPDTLVCMNNLGMAYVMAGKTDKGRLLHEETLKLRRATFGPEHPDTLISSVNLATAYLNLGQNDRALNLYEETLKLMKANLGPDHPATVTCMSHLAGAYQKVSKFNLAVPLYEETVNLRRAKFGPEHPDTLVSRVNLATAYLNAGQNDWAVKLYEETLQLLNAKLGPTHPYTLGNRVNLARAYGRAGSPDEALRLYDETWQLAKANLGLNHPTTLTCMDGLAVMYWRGDRLDMSIPLFEESLKRHEAKLGRNHLNTLMTVANLGVNYKSAGRFTEAIPLLEEAYRASAKHPRLRFAGRHLQEAYEKVQEHAKLANLLQEQLPEARQVLPKNSPQLAGMLFHIGKGLLMQSEWTQAEAVLRESLAIWEKTQDANVSTSYTKLLLGVALLGQKKYKDAEPLLQAGFEGMKQGNAEIPPQVKSLITEVLERLVQLYEAGGKKEAAAKWRKELETVKANPPRPGRP